MGFGTHLPDELIANLRQAKALRMDRDAERAILLREAGGAAHGRLSLAVDIPALLHPRAADVLGAVHDRAGACGKRALLFAPKGCPSYLICPEPVLANGRFHKESDAEQSVSFLTVAGGAAAAAVDDVVSPLPLEDHHALHKIVGEEPPDLDLRALTQVLRFKTRNPFLMRLSGACLGKFQVFRRNIAA